MNFWKTKIFFDVSKYSNDSKYFNEPNENVIGKFKNESNGRLITEYVIFRRKMYSQLVDNDAED